MDLQDEILGIITRNTELVRVGLKHGEQAGLGKVVDECNRLLDLHGLSGEWNEGFRAALLAVRSYILAELKASK